LTARSTSSEPTICGIARGDTKAPTSIVCSPASSNFLTKAMRSAGLTGVFSFCSPSRAPISMMWMVLLIGASSGFDLGEFDAFLHDIADLAFDRLQRARERRTQGLLHLHDLERQDRCALFQFCALLRQHRDDRSR